MKNIFADTMRVIPYKLTVYTKLKYNYLICVCNLYALLTADILCLTNY